MSMATFTRTVTFATLFSDQKGYKTVSRIRTLYLWLDGEPESALKINFLGDELVLDRFQAWAIGLPVFSASFKPPAGLDPLQKPLFANGLLFPTDDPEHPGGS